MLGGMTSYPKKKLAALADAEKRFYTEWDDNAFTRYMKEFGLDLNKRIEQLSDGMRVKFSLALALSHNASLFVLDEPTSGLVPFSLGRCEEDCGNSQKRGHSRQRGRVRSIRIVAGEGTRQLFEGA